MSTYEGSVESPDISGVIKIEIGEDGVLFRSLFDQVPVSYADISSIRYFDYSAYIAVYDSAHSIPAHKTFQVSKMGQQTEWFFRELLNAYNAKILSAMHEDTKPLLESRGSFSYVSGNVSGDNTDIAIYDDALCILPSDDHARRIPFVFINNISKGDYNLTISDTSGESYVLSKFGYDLDPIEKALMDNIYKLRETNKEFIEKINASLGFSDLSQAQILFSEGIATKLDKLPAPLVASIKKLMKTCKMSAEFAMLDEIGIKETVAIGMLECPEESDDCNLDSEEEKDPWIIYYVTSSKNDQYAIVEFSFPNEDAATYIFRTGGQYDTFLTVLNYALEATGLQRDIISLPPEKLTDEMKILRDRTPAIELLRHLLVGKAIHRSPDSWKKSVLEMVH